jgi:hypothetical protein
VPRYRKGFYAPKWYMERIIESVREYAVEYGLARPRAGGAHRGAAEQLSLWDAG